MKDRIKPTFGCFALTSCYGCQLKIATLSKILEIADSVDIVSWHMVSSASDAHAKIDIAFVEGSVSTEKDLEELKEIRKNAKVLVAIGACAINGGVQSWAEGEKTYDELYKTVYGDSKHDIQGIQAQPIAKYVKVDFNLPGCPPEDDEIIYFLSTFLFGSWPEERDYPVCSECRIEGNPCILIEKGELCLGPITTAGCKARCISFGVPCIGCRGPINHDIAWFDSLALVFKNMGTLSKERIRQRMAIFSAHDPSLDKRLKKIFGGEET